MKKNILFVVIGLLFSIPALSANTDLKIDLKAKREGVVVDSNWSGAPVGQKIRVRVRGGSLSEVFTLEDLIKPNTWFDLPAGGVNQVHFYAEITEDHGDPGNPEDPKSPKNLKPEDAYFKVDASDGSIFNGPLEITIHAVDGHEATYLLKKVEADVYFKIKCTKQMEKI